MTTKQSKASHFARAVGSIVFLTGATFFAARLAQSEQREHASLIDPAKTECIVCHDKLSAADHGIHEAKGCLDCHNFLKTPEGTLVTVERRASRLAPVVSNDGDGSRSSDRTDSGDAETSAQSDLENRQSAPRVDPGIESSSRQPAPEQPSVAPARNKAQKAGPVLDRQAPSGPSDDLYSDGLEAFRRGRYEVAFESWRAMLERSSGFYTVQVEVDRYLHSVQDLFAKFGDHRLFVVVREELYWVFCGLFATRTDAEQAVSLLPRPLQEGGAFPIAVVAIAPGR